ncbi:MAG: ECF-type sigma factor [Planctomycetota bacterium]
MKHDKEDIPDLLKAISRGDPAAKSALFSVLYKELHAMAHKAMMKEYEGITLQTTALVHETYMSLVKNKGSQWQNPAHFYSVAARVMRFILVDEARKRKALKRKAQRKTLRLNEAEVPDKDDARGEYLEELDRALEKLARQHERQCTIVELRFFAGLTLEKTAEVLNLSKATVKRDWDFTKNWLRRELNISDADEQE